MSGVLATRFADRSPAPVRPRRRTLTRRLHIDLLRVCGATGRPLR
ncbi:cell envelope biogenesis protein OmpA [Streptomyces sp. NRRL F-5630]